MKVSKHQRMFSSRHLQPGEAIVAVGEGRHGKYFASGSEVIRVGILIVTNARIVFYSYSVILDEVVKEIPFASLRSLEQRTVWGRPVIRLCASDQQLEFRPVDKVVEAFLVYAIALVRPVLAADNSAVSAAPSEPLGSTKAKEAPAEGWLYRKGQELVASGRAQQRLDEYGPINAALVCPHCQQRGGIRTKRVQRKKGFSPAKVAGVVLLGVVALPFGLSRKEQCTQAHCDNCASDWDF